MARKKIKDVMTSSPRMLDASASVAEAAQLMERDDIGDVIVCMDGKVWGIVTDRDITIRVTAHATDPTSATVGDVCSGEVVTMNPNDSVDDAVRIMREKAIRRIPIVDDDGRPVGIVSLGDLALTKDRESALADVSAAPANH
jgi:CBS domain-containing protein